jgi:negative regulator of sigma E activity
MNETKLEALSALMDGEMREADARLLDGWSRDEDLRAAWGRYHLIAECIRGTLPRHMDPALAKRVAVALRGEPAILAPAAAAPRPWLKPLTGMAIAASVAALAVTGIQVNRGAEPDTASAPAVATRAPASGAGGQFNFAAGNGGGYRQVRPVVATDSVDPRLNRYLINYTEQRGATAVQGVPPYVRVLAEGRQRQQ